MLLTPKLIKILISLSLWTCLATQVLAQTTVATAFPGTVIEPELQPLMEEFLSLSLKAKLELPLRNRITRISIVSHEELLKSIKSRGHIRAVTIMEADQSSSTVLLTEDLRQQPEELRIVLFHELLHVAGYDHPRQECHWAEEGCGIMGYSPFPHLRMGREHADEVIRKSFKPRYLARLPLIDRSQ